METPNIDALAERGVNGLDSYPTILSWVGAEPAKHKQFDGADISRLLKQNPPDASPVLDADGKPRDTMVWHFPNSVALESPMFPVVITSIRSKKSLPNTRLQRA